MNLEGLKPYAKVFGIVAFIVAISVFLLSTKSILLATFVATIFGVLALLAGYKKGLSVATLIIIGIDFMAALVFAPRNRFLTLLVVAGIAAMIYLLWGKTDQNSTRIDENS